MAVRGRLARALLRRHGSLRRLLPRGYHAYPGPGGWIYLDLRESPMMLARALRSYERSKVSCLQAAMGPGKVFVDVGGNKGDFALLAARASRDSGRVLCIEPEPGNAEWIRLSAARNGYRSVEVIAAALADRDGEAELHLGEMSGWHTLVDDPRASHVGVLTVTTRTLDGLLAERGIERVDVVKIDVEGAEDLVLAGAERALSGPHPMTLLLDLHPPRVDPIALCAQLEGWGFELREPDGSTPLRAGPQPNLREVVAVRP